MKFTLSWLKDHLETEASLEEIVETLTMIGLEVESVDDKSALKAFKIARVLTAERHPDADKLQVLAVDTGDGKPVQVVCGAPNARAGLIGVLGAPGTYVPGLDVTLAVGKIRGVESHGMMCSERELELSDEHNGIIDLPVDASVGTSFAAYAGLDDPVIEINLTPNRPDATGVYGIARDLAAAGLGRLKDGTITPIKGDGATPVKLIIEAPDLCPGFALRLVRSVKNGPSPKWLQQRLKAIGLRPINALVDITNYITFDRGRPLHVFDAAKVKGDLVVRRATAGETVLALDGREYKLNDQICVIADDNGIESIAGIMGGEHSGCDENTTDVLIESALWNPQNIARTGRELGIITDARYRFERGADPEFMVPGLELATRMVLDLCGGTAAETEVVGYGGYEPKKIIFPVSEVKRLTGIEVSKSESLDILARLGFKLEGDGDVVNVLVPSWRPDIDGKADLVEEVMRIHGVDNIAPQPLASHATVNGKILTTLQIRTRAARRALAARGMMEAVTWSFIPAAHAEAFGRGDNSGAALKLANPIAADMSDMRPSLLPGLLAGAQRNADRGFNDLALFEVSGTYEGDTPDKQRRVAGGIRRGTAKLDGVGRHWAGNAQNVGVFDAKADALAVLEACGVPVDRVQIEAGGPAWYHPGRSGTIKLGPKVVLGHFGEFHPKTLETLDVSGALCGFEVFIDTIPEPKQKPTRTKPPLTLSSFQTVRRDFAFVVDKTTEAAAVIRAAGAADKKLISGIQVFDIFEGPALGAGKKSIAIEVAIQPQERTLTDEDLDGLAKRIVESVGKQTGGVLRG
ncbi:phenylalanine--tRNA ligase subunit beta [Phyllobacterium leguminum]|uniref:Phenylalanine--tRNA ligase beta subunit n=1 Tax=Phyllobacterium leguminum TaxID=314237 RepID=A0A318T2X5_9HYPH|nr:phenylalanine--tRNA ligase subunit beta [Phyllobacterium leguminum]PYE86357.1 phenylalanyl-tRNA synthetase beta subunit [Phyllobacterium leguminum]